MNESQVAAVNDRDLAAAINSMHDGIVVAARSSLSSAITIGEMLADIRDRQPHGTWLGWCKANLNFTSRTAANYIALFNRRDSLKLETVSNLKEAYRVIAGPAKPKPETRGALMEDATDKHNVQPDGERAAQSEGQTTPKTRAEYSEAAQIWSGVKPRLDAIRDTDFEATAVFREVIDYAHRRLIGRGRKNYDARLAKWRATSEDTMRNLLHAAGDPEHELAFAHCLKCLAAELSEEIERRVRADARRPS